MAFGEQLLLFRVGKAFSRILKNAGGQQGENAPGRHAVVLRLDRGGQCHGKQGQQRVYPYILVHSYPPSGRGRADLFQARKIFFTDFTSACPCALRIWAVSYIHAHV